MTLYTAVGVGTGALLRNQVAVLAVVVGYLYFVEIAILAIPRANAIDPFLPGRSNRVTHRLGYLTDAMPQQTGHASGQQLPAPAGALILLGYALTGTVLAIALPQRRDIT